MAQHISDFSKSGMALEPDGRLDAPAFHRNHEPIWEVLAPFLGAREGEVLEVGSGTGRHVVEFARRTPSVVWWASDHIEAHLQSIAAWRAHDGLKNMRGPLRIDLADADWAAYFGRDGAPESVLAIVCINVLHIAPWRVTEGLMRGAGRLLRSDGQLFVYGPFQRHGQHTTASNAAFDAGLRSDNPEWGVRDLDEVARAAEGAGLRLMEAVEMPANNFTLIFAPR
jgi:SAM-dependent methyltransferase